MLKDNQKLINNLLYETQDNGETYQKVSEKTLVYRILSYQSQLTQLVNKKKTYKTYSEIVKEAELRGLVSSRAVLSPLNGRFYISWAKSPDIKKFKFDFNLQKLTVHGYLLYEDGQWAKTLNPEEVPTEEHTVRSFTISEDPENNGFCVEYPYGLKITGFNTKPEARDYIQAIKNDY